MQRLPDRMLIKAALNTYAKHLRGFKDNPYANDLKRVEELQTKEIVSNNVAIVIKLEI